MLKALHHPIRELVTILSAFSRPSLVVITFLMLSPLTVRRVAADDDPQLKVIHDGYVQTITSIRNVWCRYEVLQEPTNPNRKFLAPKRVICEWAIDGEKYHFSFTGFPRETEAGIHRRPYWESTDGKYFWSLQYTDQDKIDHAIKKQLRDGTWRGQVRDHIPPGQFLGLYFTAGKPRLTLQSILEKVPLTFGGKETIDGHECWRVDFDYPGAASDIPMTVFFDPTVNFLPRRLIQHSTSGGDPRIRTVVKFAKMKDGEGQTVYFPWEMRNEDSSTLSRIKILQVQLNEKLPDTLYRPQLPEGVEVVDLDKASDAEALRRKR